MAKDVIEVLQEVGIDADYYKRPPVTKDVFIASLDRRGKAPGKIRIWVGNAILKAFGNKKHNQAVIVAKEDAREISFNFGYDEESLPKRKKQLQETLAEMCEDSGIILPEVEGITYEVVSTTIMTSFKSKFNPDTNRYEQTDEESFDYLDVDAVAKIPPTTQTLLVGKDETSYFIAALPEEVRSVTEAHEVLKPPEAEKEGTLRQGEWFFVPVDEEGMQEALWKINEKVFRTRSATFLPLDSEDLDSHRWGVNRGESTHTAQVLVEYNDKIYAIGIIRDTRKDHHSPLVLPEWYQVVRNREVQIASQERSQYWD